MKSSHRRMLLVGGALLLGAGTVRAAPYVGYVHPCGLQRGTTNVFLVGGQGFWGKMETAVSGPGLRVLGEKPAPPPGFPTTSQRKWIGEWLVRLENGVTNAPPMPTNATARVNEWISNRCWTVLHTLSPLERRIVARDVFGQKDRLQQSPSLRQMRLVTIAADRTAPVGARALTVCGVNGGAAPQRPFFVTDLPHAAEPSYAPKAWRKAVTNAAFRAARERTHDARRGIVLDGRILPGETDVYAVRLSKGVWRACTYGARLQPIVGDAVPGYFKPTLTVEGCAVRSRTAVRHDPTLVFDVPRDGVFTVRIGDGLFRGRADFVYAVTLVPVGASDGLEAFGRGDPYAVRYEAKTGAVEGGGVRVGAPFTVYARTSTFATRAGWSVSLPLTICRQPGFEAPIVLQETADFRFANGYVPPGTNAWTAQILPKSRTARPLAVFDLWAVAVTNGTARVSRVVPADEYEQAFAWKHLLEQPSFLFKVFPPQKKRKSK